MKFFVSFALALILLSVQISTATQGYEFFQKLARAYPFAMQYPVYPRPYYDPRLYYNSRPYYYPYYNREKQYNYVVNSGFAAGSTTTGYTNGVGAELNKNFCGIQSTNGHGNAGPKDINFQSCGQNMLLPDYFKSTKR